LPALRVIAHSFSENHMKLLSTIALALWACACTAGIASAHDYKVGSLNIVHPWTRATPKGATVGGGFLKITNNGTEPDRLVGGSSPISARFEIHEMSMDNGVMRMRQLKDGLVIKPGETVELKPGSLHLMFVDLKEPIKEGDRLKGTLEFEKAGKVEVDYVAVAVGASPSGEHKPAHGAAGGHNH
jgi:copper(I)-binding protein